MDFTGYNSHRLPASAGLCRNPATAVRGATVTEVLVAAALISLLAGLLLPVIQLAREQGMIAQSSQNLRQLALANLAYAADHGTFCPAGNRLDNNIRWHGVRPHVTLPFDPAKGYLAPYLGDGGKARICPLFAREMKGRESFEMGSGGYGYNDIYIGRRPDQAFNPLTNDYIGEYPARLTRPANTVMFATTAYARIDGLQEYPYTHPPFWARSDGTPRPQRPSPSLHFRARGKALVAWADGRVSAEIMEDRPHGYNPHGGDTQSHAFGWFGPDDNNGFWNSRQ